MRVQLVSAAKFREANAQGTLTAWALRLYAPAVTTAAQLEDLLLLTIC